MKKKGIPIGEIGVIDGVKVECCKKYHYCDGCAFQHDKECPVRLCMSTWRSDNNSVYFKKVE